MAWDERPTSRQVRAITLQCIRLGITDPLEERVSTRAEARSTLYTLHNMKGNNVTRRCRDFGKGFRFN